MSESRAMPCDDCGGDGEHEVSEGGYIHGPSWSVRCPVCNGTGEVEVELIPLTEDDAEELAHAANA